MPVYNERFFSLLSASSSVPLRLPAFTLRPLIVLFSLFFLHTQEVIDHYDVNETFWYFFTVKFSKTQIRTRPIGFCVRFYVINEKHIEHVVSSNAVDRCTMKTTR